jgi:aldehyde dehydrogenase (NAD+)
MNRNAKIKLIDKVYINGEFVKPDGTERMDIINP